MRMHNRVVIQSSIRPFSVCLVSIVDETLCQILKASHHIIIITILTTTIIIIIIHYLFIEQHVNHFSSFLS